MSTQPVVAPELYDLTNTANGDKVYYNTDGPELWYGPPAILQQFTANQITITPLPVAHATLVTVTWESTSPMPFHNSTNTLTVLLLDINLGNTPQQPITTIAFLVTFQLDQPPFFSTLNLSGYAYVG